MSVEVIQLTPWDLATAALLLVFNGILSITLKLGLTRSLAIAGVRMVIQLLLVGLVLRYLFETTSAPLTLLVVVVMIAFAGYEIMSRQDRTLTGLWSYGLGISTMAVAAVSVTLLALTTQLRPDPWYDARYAVPLLGMMLGNAMTGIALGLNGLLSAVPRERHAIEAQLALGFTRWDAMGPLIRSALRSGFMPTINAMAACGLVSLPGMMTGQILAGQDPMQAVKYQILVMFLIAGATGTGTVMAVLGAAWRLTDDRHRLRLDRLKGMEF